jgi:predicted dehydrogenase
MFFVGWRMLNIALIGYGYWGPNILRNLYECGKCRVAVCCDSDPAKLAKAKARYPSVEACNRLEQVLENPKIDAVFIATPISSHFPLASSALRAGKHVFVEKPMAASSAEAQKLIDAAAEKKLTLMVGHTFEYSPPVRKIKEILDRGDLGDIFFISSTRVNLGLHQKDVSVIWDLAPHDFSIIFHLLNEGPSKLQALGRACIQKSIPDVAFIGMEFPSGLVAQLELSWLAPSKIRNLTIVGSKRMLIYDDMQVLEKVKLFDHGVNYRDPETFGQYHLSYRTGDIVSPKLDTAEPLLTELCHFLECVEKGVTPRSDGASGLRVVKALELAEKSLRAGGAPQTF